MTETKQLENIVRESFVACSPKGRSVRSFRVLCDIMPGDRERIADALDRLSRLEAAVDAVIAAWRYDATSNRFHTLQDLMQTISALAEARGQK